MATNNKVLTQGIEIGAGCSVMVTSCKGYVSVSLAAAEFGSKKLDANLIVPLRPTQKISFSELHSGG